MDIPRRNLQLLFTVALAAVIAVVVGQLLTKGMSVVGEKERALKLADELMEAKTEPEYLAILTREFPPDSRLWRSPAMRAIEEPTTVPAVLEILPDGRLRVVVQALQTEQLLETRGFVYIPAALVDNRGHSYRLEDIRLNSRGTDLVFEYYFRPTPEAEAVPGRTFDFFLGRRRWKLEPRPAAQRM
jgi:hypothetical protein